MITMQTIDQLYREYRISRLVWWMQGGWPPACPTRRISRLVWWIHFDNIPPGLATCADCLDREAGLCLDDIAPLECFRDSEDWDQGVIR